MKTSKATAKHIYNAKQRQDNKKEEIRRIVFKNFCECGRCSEGNFDDLCISNKSLAGYCNTLRITTLSGKGYWKTTSISRLFPKPRTIEDFFE